MRNSWLPRLQGPAPDGVRRTSVVTGATHGMGCAFGLPESVEHGGDGIDPQAVDGMLLQPVEGVGDQVVPDLAPGVVDGGRVPVPMKLLVRLRSTPSKPTSRRPPIKNSM